MAVQKNLSISQTIKSAIDSIRNESDFIHLFHTSNIFAFPAFHLIDALCTENELLMKTNFNALFIPTTCVASV